jgi:hypothetical protein
MLFKISAKGNKFLGEYQLYEEGCNHQPTTAPGVFRPGNYSYQFRLNPDAVYTNICSRYQLPFENSIDIYSEPTEYTHWFQYVIYDAYYYGDASLLFAAFEGATEQQVTNSPDPNSCAIKPAMTINKSGNIGFYSYRSVSSFASRAKYYRRVNGQNSIPIPVKPNYRSLVNGYSLDIRKLPKSKIIIPTKTQKVKFGYYRESTVDPLQAIEWMQYELDLQKSKPLMLPIINPVLGTSYCSDQNIKSQIINLKTDSGSYPYAYLFEENLPAIFGDWNSLYQSELSKSVDTPDLGSGVTVDGIIYYYHEEKDRTLRAIGGNNDIWNNRPIGTEDINIELSHPLWIVDDQRSYDWWFAPQTDNSYGTVTMHNPKIDEIRDAINAGYYAKNPITGEVRVANLGHLLEKIAYLMGYRPEADGTLSHDKEKANVRTIISKDKPVDPTKVGVNSFGEMGMMFRRLNNKNDGKQVTANECVLVKDLPQLLAEYQDQLNLALGIQESSAISVETQNGTAKYENQLQVLVELLNLSITNHDLIRSALVSSMVAQGQTTELIAGMGLPSVTKTIPIKIDGKISDLPYQGIAAHRSLSQEIAVCTQNVGIVAGQLI